MALKAASSRGLCRRHGVKPLHHCEWSWRRAREIWGVHERVDQACAEIGIRPYRSVSSTGLRFRRRLPPRSGRLTLRACLRFGMVRRGAPLNRTPTSLPFRQTTSQSASTPSSSISSSNVSGILTDPSLRRRAPVADMSRTVQATVQCRLLKATIAPFKTRRRMARRISAFRSTSLVVLNSAMWMTLRARAADMAVSDR